MSEPEVALVFSPEPWVERLHRHCADHGGARIRQILVEPELALEEAYDVIVVSHRWPALSRALVDALQVSGRAVLGVFDPAEPAGREHLRALGVTGCIDSDRDPAEIVAAVRAVASAPVGSHASRRAAPPVDPSVRPSGAPGRVLVVAGPPGVGKTEVAVAVAASLHARRGRCVLVDVDELAPSLGPRLALPLGPTLRDAVDAAAHEAGDLGRTVVMGPKGLPVVLGLPSRAAWLHVRAHELVGMLDELARRFAWVVVDTGPCIEDVATAGRSRFGMSRAACARADVVLAVVDGSPNGVVRLIAMLGDVRLLARGAPVHVLANRAPSVRARRAELAEEIVRTCAPAGLAVASDDPRVADAAWTGGLVTAGPFRDAVERVVDAIAPGLRAERLRAGRAPARRPATIARAARAGASA
jgi:Mrp family chromosome partitioning ATPase